MPKAVAAAEAEAAAAVLVRVIPKIFSRISLLLRSDTILKSINTKPIYVETREPKEKPRCF